MPEFVCPVCNCNVTLGPSGLEYGHSRGHHNGKEKCPCRPAGVDPKRANGVRA